MYTSQPLVVRILLHDHEQIYSCSRIFEKKTCQKKLSHLNKKKARWNTLVFLSVQNICKTLSAVKEEGKEKEK